MMDGSLVRVLVEMTPFGEAPIAPQDVNGAAGVGKPLKIACCIKCMLRYNFVGFEIEDKIAKGAQYYVSTSYDDEAHMLEKEYPVLAKTSDYIIIDLRQKLPATVSATPR